MENNLIIIIVFFPHFHFNMIFHPDKYNFQYVICSNIYLKNEHGSSYFNDYFIIGLTTKRIFNHTVQWLITTILCFKIINHLI